MTDIVEELREAAELDPWYYTVNEAADEIERLREALRYYANKTQEEWVNVTGADDGVVARTALGEKTDD